MLPITQLRQRFRVCHAQFVILVVVVKLRPRVEQFKLELLFYILLFLRLYSYSIVTLRAHFMEESLYLAVKFLLVSPLKCMEEVLFKVYHEGGDALYLKHGP